MPMGPLWEGDRSSLCSCRPRAVSQHGIYVSIAAFDQSRRPHLLVLIRRAQFSEWLLKGLSLVISKQSGAVEPFTETLKMKPNGCRRDSDRAVCPKDHSEMENLSLELASNPLTRWRH